MPKDIRILFPALLLLSACSSYTDEGDGGIRQPGTKTVTLRLAATPIENTPQTREDSYIATGEKIYNGYVVMAKKEADGKETVKNIIEVPPGTEAFTEKQLTSVSVESGKYVFYNFANLPFTISTDETTGNKTLTVNGSDFNFVENDTQGVLKDAVSSATYPCTFNGYTPPETDTTTKGQAELNANPAGIPMTNREEFEVDENTSITLSLFRLLAKMRFTFKNMTDREVKIHKITLGNVTANYADEDGKRQTISFLPPKDDKGLVTTHVAEGDPYISGDYTAFDDGGDESKAISVEKETSFVTPDFYMNESQNTAANKAFPLTIELSRKEGGEIKKYTRHALIEVEKVPRNSILLIPVNLTDYDLELDAFFYPPIGGYPAYTLTKNEETEDFTATFSTGGDFVLSPSFYRLEDKDSPEKYIDLTDPNIIERYTVSVLSNPGLFSTEPYIDPVTGEILGTLKDNVTGTATVQLEIILKKDTSGEYTLNRYRRRIYITVG